MANIKLTAAAPRAAPRVSISISVIRHARPGTKYCIVSSHTATAAATAVLKDGGSGSFASPGESKNVADVSSIPSSPNSQRCAHFLKSCSDIAASPCDSSHVFMTASMPPLTAPETSAGCSEFENINAVASKAAAAKPSPNTRRRRIPSAAPAPVFITKQSAHANIVIGRAKLQRTAHSALVFHAQLFHHLA